MKHFLLIANLFFLLTGTLSALSEQKSMHTSSVTCKEKKKEKKKKDETPWFIGTYLAQYGVNIEPKRLLIFPSFQANWVPGTYDAHSHLVKNRNIHLYTGTFLIEWGITKKIDFTIDLTAVYAHTRHDNSFSFGDTQIYLGFQVAKDKKDSWIPDIRILFGENFPTGKFDHLKPRMHLADLTGTGAYSTSLVFITQKIFYTRPKHPYKWNLNLYAIHRSKVATRDLSLWGGGPGVVGIATPGNHFIANLSYEYKFGKHWGWGMDAHYEYDTGASFHTISGSSEFSGLPSSDVFSLAPEIEYNFSEDVAMQWGFWYSLFGRNAIPFFNGFVALSYLF